MKRSALTLMEIKTLKGVTTKELGKLMKLEVSVIKKFVTNTEEIRKNFEVLVQISKYHAK